MLSNDVALRRERVARSVSVAVPMLLTWGLCAVGIGRSQFRGDELCTWWAASLPPESFERLVDHVDAVLAPYYLFMRGWISVFGDSEAAMRAPSAIAMGIAAALVAAIGARLANRAIGLRAGLLFAVIPLVSRYGQEARPYAFAAMFAALSTLLLLRLLDRPTSANRVAAYATSLLCLGLSHVVALLVVVAHLATVIELRREPPRLRIAWRSFRTVALGMVLGVGGALAVVIVGAQQHGDQIGRQGTVDELVRLGRRLVAGSTLGSLLLGTVVALVVARALLSKRQPIVVRLWAVVPPVVLFAGYPVLRLWALRYLVFVLPALALLVAIATDSIRWRRRAWVTVILVVAVAALGARMQVALRSSLARSSADYRAMGETLATEARAGDAVAFGGTRVIERIPRLALAYETRGRPVLVDVFAETSMAERGRFTAEECADPASCLPIETTRLWLLTSADPGDPFAGMPRAKARLLRREFVVARVEPHWNATLVLLVRR